MQSQTSSQSGKHQGDKQVNSVLIASVVGMITVAVLVLGVFPLLVSMTVVAFLPSFPWWAIFSGWAAFVLLLALVYLAHYWLHEEPEENEDTERRPTIVGLVEGPKR